MINPTEKDKERAEGIILDLVNAEDFISELKVYHMKCISVIALVELDTNGQTSATKTFELNAYVMEQALERRAAIGKSTEGVEIVRTA